MPKRILDTSVLIAHWRRCGGNASAGKTPSDASAWAKELARLYQSNAIVMPVYIEFLAGVRNSVELQLATAYLKEFEILDNGTVEKADWSEAERVARRVPQDGRPRQLGDCLIRALAKRLRGDVATLDLRFHG